jgi:hypothetical protein
MGKIGLGMTGGVGELTKGVLGVLISLRNSANLVDCGGELSDKLSGPLIKELLPNRLAKNLLMEAFSW